MIGIFRSANGDDVVCSIGGSRNGGTVGSKRERFGAKPSTILGNLKRNPHGLLNLSVSNGEQLSSHLKIEQFISGECFAGIGQ